MKVGRKLSFDNTKSYTIIKSVTKAKGSFGQVADFNEIPRDTFYQWIRMGEDDRNLSLNTELAQFTSKLKKAQAEVVIELCDIAMIDEKKSKFLMWWLSRICREDFGAEGVELKQLRDIFAIILPLIGKGELLNGQVESAKSKEDPQI